MKIIFATQNDGKAKEVKEIFKDSGYEIFSLKDIGDNSDIIEDGKTFEENAFIKASYIYDKYKVPVIADDSGLEVEQLNNAPGIFSARYAGENCTYDDNNKKLLTELTFFNEPHNAKFLCCAIFYNGENKIIANGELKGEIVHQAKGELGFGYDPIFVPESYQKTLAEISHEEKNKISHRGNAFRELCLKLISI